MKITKEIKLALVFAVFVLFLNSVFAQNAECPPNSVDLYDSDGKVYIGKTVKQTILSNDKLDVYQHTGILMGKLWKFFFPGNSQIRDIANLQAEHIKDLADSIYQVFVINLKDGNNLDIVLEYNDNLKVNGKSWGKALDELEAPESESLVEDAKAIGSYIKKMTEPKVAVGAGPYFVFLNQNKKAIRSKITASSIFGYGKELDDISRSKNYEKPSPKELLNFLDQNGACASIYPYMFGIRRQDHTDWYVDLGPHGEEGMDFWIHCSKQGCCNCHPGVGVLDFYNNVEENYNEPLFSGYIDFYVNIPYAGSFTYYAGSFKLSPTCLLPNIETSLMVSNIAQNGEDVIVILGDGVNIEDLFPKDATYLKTGLEDEGETYPTIKKGTDGTLKILQDSQEHPNPKVKNAVKAYAIFAGIMRQLNTGDVCVDIAHTQDGKAIYTIRKLKPGEQCPIIYETQTQQIPKTENISVLFFVNKGTGQIVEGSTQQITNTYAYRDVLVCKENNTFPIELEQSVCNKLRTEEGKITINVEVTKIEEGPITCKDDCYYECLKNKCEPERGWVPTFTGQKTGETKYLVKSCNNQQKQDFKVTVEKAKKENIENLNKQFSNIVDTQNRDIVDIVIFKRNNCLQNNEPYVIPEYACIPLTCPKGTAMPPTPPPTRRPRKFGEAKITGAVLGSSKHCRAQNPAHNKV